MHSEIAKHSSKDQKIYANTHKYLHTKINRDIKTQTYENLQTHSYTHIYIGTHTDTQTKIFLTKDSKNKRKKRITKITKIKKGQVNEQNSIYKETQKHAYKPVKKKQNTNRNRNKQKINQE